MGCNLVVGANSFAALFNRQIHRANKFTPTDCDFSRNQIGLNGKASMLAVKIQESNEEFGV